MEYSSDYSNEYINIDDLLLEGEEEEEMNEEDEKALLDELRRDFMINLQMWE